MFDMDTLVKLASLGTSGVCVLAVFWVGAIILKLPKDTPSWKADLMRRYLTVCVVVAVISALSGAANAYFNREKVQVAQAETQKVEETMKQNREAVQQTQKALREVKDQLDSLNSAVSPLQKRRILESLKKAQGGTELVLSRSDVSGRPGR